jgi:hypothetical protein
MIATSERNAVMIVRAGLAPQLTPLHTIGNESDATLFDIDRKRFRLEKLFADSERAASKRGAHSLYAIVVLISYKLYYFIPHKSF